MSIKPLPPAVASEPCGLPDLTSPTTLEALLAMRPSEPRPQEKVTLPVPPVPPAKPPVLVGGSTAAIETTTENPSALDLNASLLFIHAGTTQSAPTRAWVQRMCGSSQVRHVSFHENPIEQVQRHQPQAVLIHFEPSGIEAAVQLVAQLQIVSPHLPRVAIGHINNADCVLAALRSGVQDFLDVDGSLQAAQKTVRELIERVPQGPADSASAPLTAILSARAGLGSSLLASHLAWYLQESLGSAQQENGDEALDSLLIDLGSPNGDCSLYLNTASEFTFLDAVNNLRRFDRRLASSGLARHSSGLRTLILPRQSGLLRDVSYADVDALIQRLRQYFRHVIADLGAVTTTHLAMRVALRASQIWVVCDQSIPSIVSTSELLKSLDELKIERSRMQLIVSRHDEELGLSAAQIATQLQLPLLTTIPDRRRPLTQAVNQGLLLPSLQRREPYVQALNKLCQLLLTQHHSELALSPTSTPRGFARFFPRLARS